MRTPKLEAPKKFEFDPNRKNGEELIHEIREYELITPLFGGGAETKKPDEVSVVRATEIRGHLRFWWRATRGGQFNGDLEEMKKHEDAIFGSTERNSALQIELVLEEDYEKRKEENEKKAKTAYSVSSYYKDGKLRYRSSSSAEIAEYAAFPLQPKDEEKEDGWKSEVCIGVNFTASIAYPKEFRIHKKDKHGNLVKDEKGRFITEKSFDSSIEIHSAFWAWEWFGGIGARTRRGFGALSLLKHQINGKLQYVDFFESREKLLDKAKKCIAAGKVPKGVPYLPQDLRLSVKDLRKTARETWKGLIEIYKDFRQQRKVEVVTDPNGRERRVPKRSKWNEPETIRELTGNRQTIHRKLNDLIFEVPKFPRAAFGLPIVTKFHYKDEYDPKKTFLTLESFERFSSPLILRPLSCGNGKFVGIALILENEKTLDEIGLVLEEQEGKKRIWNTTNNNLAVRLTDEEARNIRTRDNSDELLKAGKDVLESFLKHMEAK